MITAVGQHAISALLHSGNPNPVDWITRVLNLMEQAPSSRSTKFHRIGAERFSDAIHMGAVGEEFGMFCDAKPSDVGEPINMTLLRPNEKEGGMMFSKLRKVSPAQVRGRVDQRFADSKWLFEFSLMWTGACDGVRTARNVVRWVDTGETRILESNGDDFSVPVLGRWQSVGLTRATFQSAHNGYLPCREDSEFLEDEWLKQMHVAAQITDQYSWRVKLRTSTRGLFVSFWTTPTGVRELFRFRDLDPNLSRRAPLIHWVTKHARRLRCEDDPESIVWVRKHLRGRTQFKFAGLEGVVVPARAEVS